MSQSETKSATKHQLVCHPDVKTTHAVIKINSGKQITDAKLFSDVDITDH